MRRRSVKFQAWATLLALALVGGSSYILIKKSLVDFEPLEVGFLRITIAGVAFLPFVIRLGRGLHVKEWATLFLIGVLSTGLPSFLFPIAQQEISSSLAAAISSLTPLMTVLVGIVVFRTKLSNWQLTGILVGLLGAILLVGARYGYNSLGAGEWPLVYVGAALLATLCYGLSSNLVKARFPETNPLLVSAGAMAPLSIVGIIGLVALDGLPVGFSESDTLLNSYLAVLFLGLIGTATASWLYFRLVRLTEPVFASTVSYLVPMVAFGWGIFDGEVVTLNTLIMLLIILVGVYLSRR